MPKTYTNSETIVIPFPEEKFYYQLKRVGVSNEDKLTFFKLAQLMVNSIGDFREGKMSLDELSEILNTLRWNENGFFHKQDEELQDRFFEIGNVLESGAELSYYLDAIPYFV